MTNKELRELSNEELLSKIEQSKEETKSEPEQPTEVVVEMTQEEAKAKGLL